MKRGHSNVDPCKCDTWPENPEVARIALEGGPNLDAVKELPPLALREAEWKEIGITMGWLHPSIGGMRALTVVFWEGEVQFAIENPEGSGKAAALKLQGVLDTAVKTLRKDWGDEWTCSDLRKRLKQYGYKVSRKLPIDSQYWSYHAQ